MADNEPPSLSDLAGELAGDADVKEEAVAQDATTEESSTEETKTTEEEAAADSTESEDDGADASDTEETTEEDSEQSPAEQRKAQLNTEIRDLVTQRRELMQEVEQLNAQVYAPQSVDDIMAETGQSQAEARITAMEQRQELSDYNNRIAEAQLVIGTESERVLNDFPMFNPDSPQYKADVATQAAELLKSNLLYDQNTGQIIGSNISPYQLYKTIASANQASAVENQIKGQRNAERMLSAADPQSSASETKTVKQDPFLAGLTKGYGDRLSGN
jgi:outer membrane murein-binding lipoprotein Lpp